MPFFMYFVETGFKEPGSGLSCKRLSLVLKQTCCDKPFLPVKQRKYLSPLHGPIGMWHRKSPSLKLKEASWCIHMGLDFGV